MYHGFHKNIKQCTTVFHFDDDDNNNKCFLSNKSAY